MALLRVVDGPTRAPSLAKAQPACQGEKSAAGQAVSPPATAGAGSGGLVAGGQKTTIHTSTVNREDGNAWLHSYIR